MVSVRDVEFLYIGAADGSPRAAASAADVPSSPALAKRGSRRLAAPSASAGGAGGSGGGGAGGSGGVGGSSTPTSPAGRRASLRGVVTRTPGAGRKNNVANLAYMPWNRWSRRGALMFEDDLTIRPRTKLNNQGAHAMGVKFNSYAEKETDVKLRQRFLELSCESFSREIATNPSSPVTLRYLATNLFMLEALKHGVPKVKVRGCMPAETYWGASCRYIEFLYLFSLSADRDNARTLCEYAVFLGAFGQPALKSAWMLCQSLALSRFDSEEESTAALLLETLQVSGAIATGGSV